MVLNWIWIAFFAVAFLMALGRTLVDGDLQVWSDVMNASFDQAAFAFEVSLGLTGVLTLWMGIMKVGERGGVIEFFGRLISPFFSRLFPGVPKGHPAMGAIFMNISANMLGLDNAATPMGLRAMQEMQTLNPNKDTATDAMIMFLVLNSSGLCLVPISIMMYRAQGGAANPTDVFVPILIATAIATLVGLGALCLRQRIRMDRVIWSWLGGIAAFVALVTWFFSSLPADKVQVYSTFFANVILFAVIIAFLGAGVRRRLRVYDVFIEGARDGFKTAVMIIPYLVAILVAIGMFRASGALDVLTGRKLRGLARVRHAVGGRASDHAYETPQRERQLCHDARCDESQRRGCLCQQTCGSRAWLNRHNILYTRSLFRIGRSDQDPLCRRLCTPCGPHRSCRGSGGGLLLLLTVASASLTRTASG